MRLSLALTTPPVWLSATSPSTSGANKDAEKLKKTSEAGIDPTYTAEEAERVFRLAILEKKEKRRCILEVKMATERARRYLEKLRNRQREKDEEVTGKVELGPTIQTSVLKYVASCVRVTS